MGACGIKVSVLSLPRFPEGVVAPEVSLALMAEHEVRGDRARAIDEADAFLERFPEDARGEEVEKDPVYPTDLISAIYGRLGFNASDTLPHPQGLTIPLVPARDASAGPNPLNALI